MKTAVVYYSMSGNTKMIAGMIADALDVDIIEIVPQKAYPDKGMKKFLWGGKAAVMGDKPALEPYSFDADQYDRIIFGSPVWASNITPPLRSFIAENKESLKSKSFGLFLCFSGGGADKAVIKLKNLLGVDDFIAELILVDPKEQSSSQYENEVKRFCKQLK